MQKTAILATLLTISSVSLAEEAQSPQATTHSWYAGLGRISFDETTARQEGVDSSANFFRAGWEMEQSTGLIVGAGFGYYEYSDNRSFSQRTEDNFGNIENSDSDASALSLYGEVGYGKSYGKVVNLDIIGGLEQFFSSERSIPNCSDCESQDIDINAGFYIKPRFRIVAENGFTFTLSYQNYISGDTSSSISATFGATY